MPASPSGLNLALRYRPRTFTELTGQRHVAAVLGRAVLAGSVAPQLLFSGGSGLGKTTVARICAAALLCETALAERPAGDACGRCTTCLDITTPGRTHPDVIELDAASHGRVDEIRGIAESAQFVPVRANRKIYIVDEAHGLSGPGGQAFLKLLEEPPPHVVFMLATTDPEKMLATNRGRCVQFELLRPSDDELVANLHRVARGEGWELSDEAARAVVASTDPALGVRGTLMTLEKLAPALRRGDVLDDDAIAALLGVAPVSLVGALTAAVEAGSRASMLTALAELRAQTSEESIRTALLGWARAQFRDAVRADALGLEMRAYELVADAPAGPVATEILLTKLCDPHLDPDPAAAAAIVQGAEAKVTELVRIARAARELLDSSAVELEAQRQERAQLRTEVQESRALLTELHSQIQGEVEALHAARGELDAARLAAASERETLLALEESARTAHGVLQDDLTTARRAVTALRTGAGSPEEAPPAPAQAAPASPADPASPTAPAPRKTAARTPRAEKTSAAATPSTPPRRGAVDAKVVHRFVEAAALAEPRVGPMLAACTLTPGTPLSITAPARAREVMSHESITRALRRAAVAVGVEYELRFE